MPNLAKILPLFFIGVTQLADTAFPAFMKHGSDTAMPIGVSSNPPGVKNPCLIN
jgi:hypothetical protein